MQVKAKQSHRHDIIEAENTAEAFTLTPLTPSPIVIPKMSLSIPLIYGHYRRVAPGWSYHDHHHTTFEWLYCVEGSVIEWVKDEPYRLQTGDWLLLKPGVRHSTLNDSAQDFAYVSISFDTEDPELRSRLWATPLIHVTSNHADALRFQHFSSDLLSWLTVAATEGTLQGAHESEMLLSPERRLSFISLMLHLVMTWVSSLDTAPVDARNITAHEAAFAHSVARLLEAQHSKVLLVSELAAQFHVSRNHLSRIFAKVYSMSPRQYLSILQMRKAKELLIHTPMSVEQIAIELGFASLSHFSRQFKRWSGISPKQFRPTLSSESIL